MRRLQTNRTAAAFATLGAPSDFVSRGATTERAREKCISVAPTPSPRNPAPRKAAAGSEAAAAASAAEEEAIEVELEQEREAMVELRQEAMEQCILEAENEDGVQACIQWYEDVTVFSP